MFQLSPAIKTIILINILVFVMPSLLGSQTLVNDLFSLHNPQSDKFYPWQWLTYMFVHANFSHIFFNMLGLLVFGNLVESALGTQRFVLFYLACGIGAGLLFSVVDYYTLYEQMQAMEAFINNPSPNGFSLYLKEFTPQVYTNAEGIISSYKEAPNSTEYIEAASQIVRDLYNVKLNNSMVGASGAVYAVMAAVALIFPNLEFFLLFPPIPIKAKYLVGFYALFSIYSVIIPQAGSNVAHLAHLGGMIFGAIFILSLKLHRN